MYKNYNLWYYLYQSLHEKKWFYHRSMGKGQFYTELKSALPKRVTLKMKVSIQISPMVAKAIIAAIVFLFL